MERTVNANFAPAGAVAPTREHQGVVFAVGEDTQFQFGIYRCRSNRFPFGHAPSLFQTSAWKKLLAAALIEVKAVPLKVG
jgi:hypothetical protein